MKSDLQIHDPNRIGYSPFANKGWLNAWQQKLVVVPPASCLCDVISAVIGFPSLISQLPASQWQLPHTVAAVDTDVERSIMKTLRINAEITRRK